MKRKVHPHEKVGELNIVPYLDIMVNLTMFMLVSMTSVIQLAIINVNVPTFGGASSAASSPDKPKDEKPLMLNVAISPRGFYIAGSGGVLAGDSGTAVTQDNMKGLPPTVPLSADGKYDYKLLKQKMVDVKDKYPSESKIILTADPTVQYDILVQTMDAVREDGPRKLFYDVIMGAM